MMNHEGTIPDPTRRCLPIEPEGRTPAHPLSHPPIPPSHAFPFYKAPFAPTLERSRSTLLPLPNILHQE